MADLICEGSCNPTLHTFDAVASFYADNVICNDGHRRREDALSLFAILVNERKKLRHTAHVYRHGRLWACGTCGAERKYGAPLDVPAFGSWGRQTASQRANRRAS
jgi:hypothetical protein